MRQLAFTMRRSRINALVLHIGQLKEHLRQRFEDAPSRPSSPSEKWCAQFSSNTQHARRGGIRERTVAKVRTNTHYLLDGARYVACRFSFFDFSLSTFDFDFHFPLSPTRLPYGVQTTKMALDAPREL